MADESTNPGAAGPRRPLLRPFSGTPQTGQGALRPLAARRLAVAPPVEASAVPSVSAEQADAAEDPSRKVGAYGSGPVGAQRLADRSQLEPQLAVEAPQVLLMSPGEADASEAIARGAEERDHTIVPFASSDPQQTSGYGDAAPPLVASGDFLAQAAEESQAERPDAGVASALDISTLRPGNSSAVDLSRDNDSFGSAASAVAGRDEDSITVHTDSITVNTDSTPSLAEFTNQEDVVEWRVETESDASLGVIPSLASDDLAANASFHADSALTAWPLPAPAIDAEITIETTDVHAAHPDSADIDHARSSASCFDAPESQATQGLRDTAASAYEAPTLDSVIPDAPTIASALVVDEAAAGEPSKLLSISQHEQGDVFDFDRLSPDSEALTATPAQAPIEAVGSTELVPEPQQPMLDAEWANFELRPDEVARTPEPIPGLDALVADDVGNASSSAERVAYASVGDRASISGWSAAVGRVDDPSFGAAISAASSAAGVEPETAAHAIHGAESRVTKEFGVSDAGDAGDAGHLLHEAGDAQLLAGGEEIGRAHV